MFLRTRSIEMAPRAKSRDKVKGLGDRTQRRAPRPHSEAESEPKRSSRPRAYWKGYLKLSLVSISVELYAATTNAHQVTLHQIHKPTGQRIRYEKVVPGVGPVSSEDIVKGFEIEDDVFVVLEPDELEEVKLESKRTIDLVQFANREDVDPRFFEKPYYLMPDGDVSTEGFLVIHAALSEHKKMGFGQLTMRGREQLVAVSTCGRGLLLETLRYHDEVRAAEVLFDDLPEIELDHEMVELASELIDRKSGDFDLSDFKDSYASALRDLVERKRKGRAIVSSEPREQRERGNIINLMEALRKSVGSTASSSRAADEKKVAGAPRVPPPRGRRAAVHPRKRRA